MQIFLHFFTLFLHFFTLYMIQSHPNPRQIPPKSSPNPPTMRGANPCGAASLRSPHRGAERSSVVSSAFPLLAVRPVGGPPSPALVPAAGTLSSPPPRAASLRSASVRSRARFGRPARAALPRPGGGVRPRGSHPSRRPHSPRNCSAFPPASSLTLAISSLRCGSVARCVLVLCVVGCV